MLNFYTDKNSGLKVFKKLDDPTQEIADYSLIVWCEQYLTKNGVFFDIGANNGEYSIILSKKCKEVHAFETDKDMFDCLSFSTVTNDCNNIKLYNIDNYDNIFLGSHFNTLDDYNINNVEFLKFEFDDIKILRGAFKFLENNKFPPFIIKITNNIDIFSYIKEMGYKVHQVRGYPNIYLAADNQERDIEPLNIIAAMKLITLTPKTNIDHNSIETLCKKYESKLL